MVRVDGWLISKLKLLQFRFRQTNPTSSLSWLTVAVGYEREKGTVDGGRECGWRWRRFN